MRFHQLLLGLGMTSSILAFSCTSVRTAVTHSRRWLIPEGRVSDMDEWIRWSNDSLQKLTGKSLLDRMDGVTSIQEVHSCSRYAVLSHGTQQDPIFKYFNDAAFLVFQFSEDEVYKLPSRYSAPGEVRDQRASLVKKVVSEQVKTIPEAIRQMKSGRKIRLKDVLLWNVFDSGGTRVGQTAMFDRESIVLADETQDH
jgi:hypothetical protein